MALRHPANAPQGNLDDLEAKLVIDQQRTVARVLHRLGQDRFLDLGRNPVRMRTAGSRNTVYQTLCAVRPEVPANLVELLARVAHHLTRTTDVVQLICHSSCESFRRPKFSFVVMSLLLVSVRMKIATPSHKPPGEA